MLHTFDLDKLGEDIQEKMDDSGINLKVAAERSYCARAVMDRLVKKNSDNFNLNSIEGVLVWLGKSWKDYDLGK